MLGFELSDIPGSVLLGLGALLSGLGGFLTGMAALRAARRNNSKKEKEDEPAA